MKEYAVDSLKQFYEMCFKLDKKAAVVDRDGERVTYYKDFILLINSIARKLKEDNIRPGDALVLLQGRTMVHFAARIACYFTGAVFVSVNPDYPEDRKEEIYSSCKPKLVVDESYISKVHIGSYDCQIDETLTDDSPGFMVYTSGTTGKPKGVLHNRSIFYIIDAMNEAFELNRLIDSFACVADMMFALSVGELYPLFFGATGHIISDGTRKDPVRFKTYFEKHKIEFSAMLPSLLRFVSPLGSLKTAYIVGERNSFDFSDIDTKVIDFYGASEVCAMSYGFAKEDMGIGREYHSSRIVLLDENGEEIKKGDTSKSGEVCYSGPAVMIGYIGDADLTEKVIDKDPVTGMRRFHTRDSARYNEDGTFTVYGRLDCVVKIRGCRVDMSEVEYRLLQIEGVSEAAVKCFDDIGENYLCAYYTTIDGRSLPKEKVIEDLKKSVPEYMIPAFFSHIASFERNIHGKIDKNALLPPDKNSRRNPNLADYDPVDAVERDVRGLFSNLFKTETVRRDDSFKALGGSSLAAIKLQIEMEDLLGITIPAAEIIRLDTPFNISEKIRESRKNGQKKPGNEPFIQKGGQNDDIVYPLINVAGRMYERIMDMQLIDDKSIMSYHTPVVVSVKELSLTDIQRVVYKLLDIHPILKARVVLHRGKPCYKKRDDWKPDIREWVIDKEPDDAFFVKQYKSFNIPEGDLFRSEVFCYMDVKYIFFDIQHLLIDGYSSWILFRDVKRVFEGKNLIPEKKSFFQSVEDVLEGLKDYEEDQKFFRNLFGDREVFMYPPAREPLFELPVYGHITGLIELNDLALRCAGLDISPMTVFLYGCMRALSEGSGRKNFILPVITFGRRDPELIRTVGCLYEIMAVPYDASDLSCQEDVQQLEKILRLINSHNFIYDAYPEYASELGAMFNYLADYDFGAMMMGDDAAGNVIIKRLPPPEYEFANMPLVVEIYKSVNDMYLIDISYNRQLYARETIESVLDNMCGVIDKCLMSDDGTAKYPITDQYPITDSAGFIYENIQAMNSYGDKRLLSYNMPMVFKMQGFSVEEMKRGLGRVFEAHSAFFAGVCQRDEGVFFFREKEEPSIEVFEAFEDEPDLEYFKKCIRAFEPGKDRLVRCELHKTGKFIYLFLDIHHLITDGYSSWHLLKDIKKAFQGTPVSREYTDFFKLLSNRQCSYETDRFRADKQYYEKILDNNRPLLYPLSKEPDNELPLYGDLYLTVAAKGMSKWCHKKGIGIHTLFIWAFMKALHQKTGKEHFSIFSFGNGREDPKAIHTLGCFYRHIPYVYEEDLEVFQKQSDEARKHSFVYGAYPEELQRVNIAFNYLAGYGKSREVILTEQIEYMGMIMPEYDYANIPLQFKVLSADADGCTIGISYNSSMYSKKDMESLLIESAEGIKESLDGGFFAL